MQERVNDAYWSLAMALTRATAPASIPSASAIVESSDDAILAKDLNGTIISWNRAAERLFGYTADEAVGEPLTFLVPRDRQDEEPNILARIRRGEHIKFLGYQTRTDALNKPRRCTRCWDHFGALSNSRRFGRDDCWS